MTQQPVLVLGVDPAPRKPAVVFDGTGFHLVAPQVLRAWLREQTPAPRPALVAWDAPLSFGAGGPDADFWNRAIDQQVGAWIETKATQFDSKAVSTQPFSCCSHWAISCHVLGMPYGTGDDHFHLVEHKTEINGPRCAIEVHPAVTLATWWVSSGLTSPMPRYKQSAKRSRDVIQKLRPYLIELRYGPLPDDLTKSDDHLDAWVAWRMGMDFLAGNAVWCGSPTQGGYVLPRGQLETMTEGVR